MAALAALFDAAGTDVPPSLSRDGNSMGTAEELLTFVAFRSPPYNNPESSGNKSAKRYMYEFLSSYPDRKGNCFPLCPVCERNFNKDPEVSEECTQLQPIKKSWGCRRVTTLQIRDLILEVIDRTKDSFADGPKWETEAPDRRLAYTTELLS